MFGSVRKGIHKSDDSAARKSAGIYKSVNDHKSAGAYKRVSVSRCPVSVSGNPCQRRILRVLVLLGCICLLVSVAAGCNRSGQRFARYEKLFSAGEGQAYRSFRFEVSLPSLDPYPVQVNDLFAYSRNTQGAHAEWCTEAVFQAAKLFTEGLGAVKYEGKWGFIRLKQDEYQAFEFAIPPIYEGAEPFAEGLAAVRHDGLYGYIDPAGNLVISPRFSSAHFFSGSLAAVADASGWYFINKSGTAAFPQRFQDAESFTLIADYVSEAADHPGPRALALVCQDGKWGYIDQSGAIVIEPQYEAAWSFDYSGYAAVKKNGRWFVINRWGEKSS